MRRSLLAVCSAVFVMSGCYHVAVITGAPASTTTINEPFQMSYVAGLVPPSEIHADQEGCASGVARVETWHSFVNFLIGGVSQNLVTPISVAITCAVGGPSPDGAATGEESASEAVEPMAKNTPTGG